MQANPRRIARFFERVGIVVPLLLAILSLSGRAEARRNGIATSTCNGCHGIMGQAEIRASTDPAMFNPGDDVTVTVTVTSSGSKVGGLFVGDPGIGELRVLDGDLRLLTGGITHTAPKNANAAGETSFRFGWRAPSVAGSVRFEVAALSGNGDGRSSGDVAGNATVSFTYGCTAATFYSDLDRDGFGGNILGSIQDCEGASPEGYAPREGDCDDNYEKVNPAAIEICNKIDDDCDGAIDEGAPPIELWPDEDGDGYYASQTGTPVMGCVPLKGYAAVPGDCAPRDPARHLDATEICNLFDDNCDGRVDERLRPQCGVGLCRRESPTCDERDCSPGTPAPETCNLLDDDCNDLVDDGATCPAGKTCMDGACVAGDGPTGGTGGSRPSMPSGAAAGTPSGGGSTGSPAGGSSSAGFGMSGSVNSVAGTASAPSAGGSAGAAGGCAVGGSRAAALGAWLAIGVMIVCARRRQRKSDGGTRN